jgi:hypothetical protein
LRTAGQAKLMKNGIHEVPRTVSGEGPACTVCAVRSGSKAQDQQASVWVAKAGDWPSPVGLVGVRTAAGLSDGGAVSPQTGAPLA